MISEHLTEQDVQDLILKFLNDARPDTLTVQRANLVLNLGVEPLLAYFYEEGYQRRRYHDSRDR